MLRVNRRVVFGGRNGRRRSILRTGRRGRILGVVRWVGLVWCCANRCGLSLFEH